MESKNAGPFWRRDSSFLFLDAGLRLRNSGDQGIGTRTIARSPFRAPCCWSPRGEGLLAPGIIAVAPAETAAVAVAVAGGTVVGAGSGMFACHIGPLVLTDFPDTHLARMQALLVLVQSLALVVGNNALGALADAQGATLAAAVCAVGSCVAGITGLALKPIRRLRQQ